MNRDTRAEVLAALREVYDGRWSRNVGTDGGRTLDWTGPHRRDRRRHHRLGPGARRHRQRWATGSCCCGWTPPSAGVAAGRRAIGNTGAETRMRAGARRRGRRRHSPASTRRDRRPAPTPRPSGCWQRPTSSPWPGPAWSTTTGATSSTRTPRRCRPGSPSSSPRSSAAPSRIGMDRDRRAAPGHPLRPRLDAAAAAGDPRRRRRRTRSATPTEVRKRLDKPRATVDRQLQALHMLGVLACDEETDYQNRTVWRYRLADGIDPDALNSEPVPDLLPHADKRIGREPEPVARGANISGTGPPVGDHPRCGRCGRGATETLIAGRCRPCAYPAGGAPEAGG